MLVSDQVLRQRTDKVRKAMKLEGLEGLVLFSNAGHYGISTATLGNVRYFTGRTSHWYPSLLVIPQRGDPALMIASSYGLLRGNEEELWIKDIMVSPVEGPRESFEKFGATARSILEERCDSPGRIGLVGSAEMPAPIYSALTTQPSRYEFESADDFLGTIRLTKGPEEIDRLRKAAEICDFMHQRAVDSARTRGKRAWQMITDIQDEAHQHEVEFARVWFSSGPQAGTPTYFASENQRELQQGDQIFAGLFIIYDGYWGHSIRAGFKGKPSAQFRKVMDIVRAAQDLGIEKLKPGIPVTEVPRAMESFLDQYLPGKTFGRSGHGLGLDYTDPLVSDCFLHSDYRLSGHVNAVSRENLLLQPGMVLELHPGFYATELGTRVAIIGDMFLITESGAERLTHFPHAIYET